MTVIEIIFAILLILSCVFIVAVVLMQESKQGMSNVISGGSSDNYFQKNSGRTKEAKLARATKLAAVVLFVVAIAVNLITVYWGGENKSSDTGVALDSDTNLSDLLSGADVSVNVSEDTDDAADTTAAEGTPAEETTAAAETTAAETTAAETTAA
ncbi:MAG: preprotein translocase subunit SecG [Ruminiclostridium sp.]|nr:preprotein translocase subunit SecG [Ruminiclostridium sp.]